MSLWGDEGVVLDSLVVEGVFGHLGDRSSVSPGIGRADNFPAASRPSWGLVLCWLSGVPGGVFLTSGATSRGVVDFSSVLSRLGDWAFNRVGARMAGSCPEMSQFKVPCARFFPGVREALCLRGAPCGNRGSPLIIGGRRSSCLFRNQWGGSGQTG